jgi:teichuronic acid exporter
MKLSSVARSSIVWSSLSRIGVQVLQLVVFVVTARWLSPAEYGTYAIVILVVTFVRLVNDSAFQAALVHDSAPSESKLTTAFWLNVAVGVFAATLIVAVAYPAESILKYPDFGDALAVAGLSFALWLTIVPSALLQRRLEMGRLAFVEFISQLIGSAVAIGLASRGFGIVSLSIGTAVTAVLMTVLLTTVTRYLPKGRPTFPDLRAIWAFSGYLLGSATVSYVVANSGTVVLAAVGGTPKDVGIYSRAYSISAAPVTQVGAVIGRVLFPILAGCRNDPLVFRNRWLRTTFASFGLLFPVTIAVAVASPYLVGALFEPTWFEMASIISILALAAPSRLVVAAIVSVFQAYGHTKELFRVSTLFSIVFIGGTAVGAFWGALGIAWGVAIASTFAAYAPLSVGLRYMEMTILKLTFEFRSILAAGFVQLLAMFGVRLVGGLSSDLASLTLSITVGCFCYLCVGWLLDRRFLSRLMGKH